MTPTELRALLPTIAPVAFSALRRGQLFVPACTLTQPDPDILAEYDVPVPVSDGFDVTINAVGDRRRRTPPPLRRGERDRRDDDAPFEPPRRGSAQLSAPTSIPPGQAVCPLYDCVGFGRIAISIRG